mgnify:CR=1 FL=1
MNKNIIFALVNYVEPGSGDEYNIFYVMKKEYFENSTTLDNSPLDDEICKIMHDKLCCTGFDNVHWEPKGFYDDLDIVKKEFEAVGLIYDERLQAYAEQNVQKFGSENI